MSEGSLITGVLVLELEPGDRLEAVPVPVTGSDTVDWMEIPHVRHTQTPLFLSDIVVFTGLKMTSRQQLNCNCL